MVTCVSSSQNNKNICLQTGMDILSQEKKTKYKTLLNDSMVIDEKRKKV